MFTALGIYPESFEKPFLEGTSEFYASEGVKYMQQADVPDYLKHVEVWIHASLLLPFFHQTWNLPCFVLLCFTLSNLIGYLCFPQTRLQEENERCLIYLDATTRKPLVATAESQLLERHISAILDKVAVVESTSFLCSNHLLSLCLHIDGL